MDPARSQAPAPAFLVAPSLPPVAALVQAHLDAQTALETSLGGLQQPDLLAMVGNALLDQALRRQLLLLRAAIPAIQNPMVKANLQSLCDLANLTPVMIAQLAQAAAVAPAAEPGSAPA